METVFESKGKPMHEMKIYEKYIKRPLDFVLSLCAIIVLSPVLLVVAVLVKIKLGSPVIFKQLRPGLHGKIFSMYKFRTMTNQKDEYGNLLPDEKRLTGFGKMLRSTSLDELPELFCILNGSMSCVGPRPQLLENLSWYTEEERHRHDVRPGLTGWAQVNGRNSVDWDTRFKLDVEYVNKISFLFDVKIILLTVRKVLTRGDVAEDTRSVEGNFAAIRKEQAEKLKQNGNGE